jgi:DNA-directed RNA polymerase subunit RPC12/RpoP
MDIKFNCPHCNRNLKVKSEAAGRKAKCPSCSQVVAVPVDPPPGDLSNYISAKTIFCANCGQKNLENNFRCTECGFPLHAPPQPQYVPASDGTLGGLIPYKNASALWAYYLAIFSLIPVFGIPPGIAAVILGIRGLKFAKVHPEAKGKAHAWIGIILGGICAAGYTLSVTMLFLI